MNHPAEITAPRGIRTRKVSYTTPRCHGRVSPADFIGKRAVYRAFDGTRLVGVIEAEDRSAGVPYLRVRFANGQHARLDSHVTLVVEDD